MSTLHRNSEPGGPALVSTRDTSPRTIRGIGHHDKVPVCNQNLPEAERSRIWDAVLPWPWEHLCSTHQEPDNNSGGRVATVSLRRGLPCQWLYHFSTECLLTSTHSIAQMYQTDECFSACGQLFSSASVMNAGESKMEGTGEYGGEDQV